MFPLSFPYKVLKSANKKDYVYDPFCGRGTTNFAARLLGLKSFGTDSNPIAHAVAQSKLVFVEPEEVYVRCSEILKMSFNVKLPEGSFWELAYSNDTLIDICKLRDYFLSKESLDEIDISLRAILLGVLHGPKMKTKPSYLSNQMPRTFSTKPNYSINYWKKHNHLPDKIDLLNLVKRKAEYVFNKQLPKKVEGGNIYLGDSRFIESFPEKVNWIVTSPPYFGMSTYIQDQWLRNWFLGGESDVTYTSKNQIKHSSEDSFIKELAKVWSNTATKSNSGAKLIVRFGALPSKSNKTPSQLIKETLKVADCGWKISTIKSAGMPVSASRQANQFQGTTGNYIEEIDVYATLKS